MNQRVVSGKSQEEDLTLDTSLRPRRLTDYIGQDGIKDNLERIQNIYYKSVGLISIMSFPSFLGLIVIAPEVTRLIIR